MNKICVLGMGYIGLPTASILAAHGYKVLGVDTDAYKVRIINNGGLPIAEPGLKTIVKAAVNSGNLVAALEPEPADAFIITVPTPITSEKKVDLSYIGAAAKSIIPVLAAGNLVILESTSPPGTTRDYLIPLLEESGLRAGDDFYVAYCPERVLPGRILHELIQNNRVIGGINMASCQAAKSIYSSFVEGEIYLTNSTEAEMVKLIENTYRDVNIALANELAVICDKLGINVWEVIKFANLHPRVNMHMPGPGVGGHCLAVDPWFIVDGFPDTARLIAMGRHINDGMPYYVTRIILNIIEEIENPKVTVLGVSYKANIDDTRESPALEILREMEKKGINFNIYDPRVRDFSYELSALSEAFLDSDLVIIIADHEEYKFLHPQEIGKLMRQKVLIDTRNCLDHNLWRSHGFNVFLLGTGQRCR